MRSCEGWKGNAGEARQGSEEQVREGRVEVRCGRLGRSGSQWRNGATKARTGEVRQAWLGAVWMELKGQAGFSRYGWVWCGEEGVGGSGKDQQARLLAWRVALRRGLESTGRRGWFRRGAEGMVRQDKTRYY